MAGCSGEEGDNGTSSGVVAESVSADPGDTLVLDVEGSAAVSEEGTDGVGTTGRGRGVGTPETEEKTTAPGLRVWCGVSIGNSSTT